ncbi:ORF136 [Ranid herpesvirus 2]|uniref:ORF136 n=1 Tax=Ranid herpesvirus 2 TaxID=389214 RepID=Q14VX0_9VIRU|nr:ORF136 [Ranid herpesvirus 2]ABG25698.1 ORF136 [Ranid herpesvirus 2]
MSDTVVTDGTMLERYRDLCIIMQMQCNTFRPGNSSGAQGLVYFIFSCLSKLYNPYLHAFSSSLRLPQMVRSVLEGNMECYTAIGACGSITNKEEIQVACALVLYVLQSQLPEAEQDCYTHTLRLFLSAYIRHGVITPCPPPFLYNPHRVTAENFLPGFVEECLGPQRSDEPVWPAREACKRKRLRDDE